MLFDPTSLFETVHHKNLSISKHNKLSLDSKISLKCNESGIFYGYTKYGNPVPGWILYDIPRTSVETSDICFVQQSLLNWQTCS